MSEMTMVERVARALSDDIDDGLPAFTRQPWEQITLLARATLMKRAEVAIKAMKPERGPTRKMIEAGYKALMEWDARTGDDMGIIEVWEAMIDAAVAPDLPRESDVQRVKIEGTVKA